MNFIKSILRESSFMIRDRSQLMVLVLVLLLSTLSIVGGVQEINQQNATIERLQLADSEERKSALSKQKNWGGAAYYTFHFTFDAPEPFAFAAIGQRDSQPWKHRVRMLALEGQIYERDANNPVFALIGRFDFSFFAAFILPFILIILLYDLRSSERKAGRYNLLETTVGATRSLWFSRIVVRALSLYLLTIIPLVITSVITGVAFNVIVTACAYLLLYVLFWTFIIFIFTAWQKPSTVILSLLIGFWSLVSIIIPTGGRMAIDNIVELPSGSDILMTQRNSVNGAWDLPKEVTMNAFIEDHPEWAEHASIKRPFEWKWYYAFQQVGDKKTAPLSNDYRAGRLKRDRLASYVALIAPPSLLERSLQRLAKTDTKANLAYENKVRQFHAELRQFFYPKLFLEEPFEQKTLIEELPRFSPKSD